MRRATEPTGAGAPARPLIVRVLPWFLFALFVASAVGLFIIDPPGTDPDGGTDVFLVVALGAFALLGAVLAARVPTNAIGWLLCLVGVGAALTGFSGEYSAHIVRFRELTRVEVGFAWLTQWLWLPSIAPVATFIPLLFPTGRYLSRFWRLVGWSAVVVVGFAALGSALAPGPIDPHTGITAVNPVGIEGAEFLNSSEDIMGWLLIPITLLSLFSVIVRFWRSRGEERQQMKWFTFTVAVMVPMFALGDIFDDLFPDILFPFVLALLPLSMTIAILKYRLYDIDVLINRTLVYGGLTAILAGVYLGIVFVLQSAVAGMGAESDLTVAASTLAVAALFSPLRRRVQAFIDHYFYRRKYDAAQTLNEFSARLRQEVDLDQLSHELATVVRNTMQPRHVSLWLRPTTSDASRNSQ